MLKNLQQRDDTIIPKANRGSAVVIMDVEHYIKEANKQLSDTSNYQKLNNDPMELHGEGIKADINNFKILNKYHQKLSPTWQGKNTSLSFTAKIS